MTGIILIGVVGAWLIAAIVMGAKIGDKLNPPWLRTPAALLLMAILIPLPVVDEIIGRFQFKALCNKYAVQIIDDGARDRNVVYVRRGMDRYAEGTILKIRIDPYVFVDAETRQKVLVSYHTLHAEGGWLIRSLGISETKSPLTFDKYCGPPDELGFRKKFNIKIIN